MSVYGLWLGLSICSCSIGTLPCLAVIAAVQAAETADLYSGTLYPKGVVMAAVTAGPSVSVLYAVRLPCIRRLW